MTEQIHETVREHYAQSALQVLDRGQAATCCDDACCTDRSVGPDLYSALERDELPSAAVMASLGCGNPTAVAELRPGERVLDLGSGGGIDVLLSARRVGPTGRAFGLDMTDEMLALARRNAAEAGATNVEFLKGTIEAIPLPADSIDVVISNCVVNLGAIVATCGNSAGLLTRGHGKTAYPPKVFRPQKEHAADGNLPCSGPGRIVLPAR